MKKLFTSIVLIAVGAGSWWLISQIARFSIKKWDAKFESVVRHGLSSVGVTNQDVLSSVHEVRKDSDGEWVVHHMSLKMADAVKREDLRKQLEESGATVLEKKMPDNSLFFSVQRGSRVYQEITFLK